MYTAGKDKFNPAYQAASTKVKANRERLHSGAIGYPPTKME